MNNAARLSDLNSVMGQVISIALGFIALAALIMIVLAGLNYLSAGADKDGTAKAKNTLTFAILGLILAVSAWMIINLFGQFLGIPNIGIFNVCWGPGC